MDMSPEQIKSIVETALKDGLAFPWWAYFVAFVIPFVGSYFGSYAKRKAENLATKEDFDELLSQVKKTTEETEKIKTDISRVSWVDQQRWTLKRELYMELLDSLYSEKEAIFKLSDEEKQPVPTESDILVLREKFIEENRTQSLAAIKRISKARGVAGVLLTDEAQKALDEIALAWYQSIEGKPEDFYARRLAAADKAYSVVLQSATIDLDVKRAS
ncbi:hypothetical protein [Dechloromonas hortensis]|uniref:hypothetical protein n=1 Tax=Dechloromonas hortensis TaxID=337779 RepID=UPI0012917E88|nr:hypothetical protein [Dechloromonas hortensis]